MRLIDADQLLNSLRWLDEYDYILYKDVKHDIDDSPTVDAVSREAVFHIETFDEMTEEYSLKEMTLEEILDKFTDEGYPYTEVKE